MAIAIDQCAICGDRLIGSFYTLPDRPERYCVRCMKRRARCNTCGAPLPDQHWRLHDGRLQCPTCHATAIYDPALAQQIFAETVAALIRQFDMRLSVGVEFRLVDSVDIATVGNMMAGDGRMLLGLYRREGRVRVIYMLHGLPRLLFRITVAHEYAHAWQTEHCPLLRDPLLREGFAEWIAYHHLRFLGCHKAAERMLADPHPYRPALDSVLDLEQKLGIAGVIRAIRTAE